MITSPESGMPDLDPPEGFRVIADRLESAGYEAWGVGGAIRDALLGVERADWDIATNAWPEQVRGLFGRTVPLGIEHGTVGVISPGGAIVTWKRMDGTRWSNSRTRSTKTCRVGTSR